MPAPPRNSLAAILAAHSKSSQAPDSKQKRKQESKKGGSPAHTRSPTPASSSSSSSPNLVAATRAPFAATSPQSQELQSRLPSSSSPSNIEEKFPKKPPSTPLCTATTTSSATSAAPASLPIYADQILTTSSGKQINVCRYNTTGDYILTGGIDRTIRLWNPETKFCIKEYQNHGWEVLDVAVSPENGKFASCGGDKQVFLWDVMSGTTLRRFSGHTQASQPRPQQQHQDRACIVSAV
ncbi:hypothetical protein DFQ26_002643 [Actinomortierella ambigua]|nr:hypothetical protein DFQ26_002643 [Actinomortierella ambigua]